MVNAASGTRSAHATWLYAGLFFVTMATLMLEVLDTRLLSVLTWYHLSFVAVSMAMLGMAAGAVLVFLGGDLFSWERVPGLLAPATLVFAIAIVLCHIGNLVIPIPAISGFAARPIAALGVATIVLTIPFVISGVIVTASLTRTSAPVGILYAVDLAGAAFGCLAIVWMLERTDITSTALGIGAAAAAGAFCFARHAGRYGGGSALAAAALAAGAFVNANSPSQLGIMYPKDPSLWLRTETIEYLRWNAHSQVTVNRPVQTHVFYWGAGANAPAVPATVAYAAIDGAAGTAITKWDGDPAWLEWTRHDVTAAPYHLRQGRAAIIGVGGGRDVLTAIAGRSTSITGIEINRALVDALEDRYRDFARVATYPGVTIVHDEARSYLTRTPERFDVLQMSLIDTWAATGAGAFTLTENGLYTRDGWRVFLRTLTPTGVFSVSRWFDPANVSETTRLVSLAVASLLDAGVQAPRTSLILITRERVATLLVSLSPFTAADRDQLQRLRDEYGFELAVTPWTDAASPQLQRIVAATSHAELESAARDRYFDFTAPSDRRPFFFNMLKPAAAFLPRNAGATGSGIVSGNLVATRMLAALGVITAVLVAAIIAWPLAHVGRPQLPRGIFGTAIAYFALIGFGFMFVQIPFLQRFSVYLGHPTYTFSIMLFLMILSAGLGSFASERLSLDRPRAILAVPLAIAVLAFVEVALLQTVLSSTVGWPLAARTLILACFVTPLAFLMGHCFPIGVRLVGHHSPEISAWMWGVNGACGVMGSIAAVMISMWLSIDGGFLLAGLLYLLLWLPMRRLLGAMAGVPAAAVAR